MNPPITAVFPPSIATVTVASRPASRSYRSRGTTISSPPVANRSSSVFGVRAAGLAQYGRSSAIRWASQVVDEEPAGVGDPAADVHLGADVDGPAGPPAREDGPEPYVALGVADLHPAQEGPAVPRPRCDARRRHVDHVDRGDPGQPVTGGVAVPDAEDRTPDGLPGGGVDDPDPQHQRHTRGAVGDVPADHAQRQVERAGRGLRCQRALGGQPGRQAERPGHRCADECRPSPPPPA